MDDLSARTGEAKASGYVSDKGPDFGAGPDAEKPRELPPAGQRALKEAEARRAARAQAGTTGALVFLSASMNSLSSLRCSFTSSGGVSASHWLSDTSA